MKRGLAALAAFGMLVAANGASATGLLDATFDNTVTISTADGTVLRSFFFNEDGTVSARVGDETIEGDWTLEGNTLCLTAPDVHDCNEIGEFAIGETVEFTDPNGTALFINVTPGRQL